MICKKYLKTEFEKFFTEFNENFEFTKIEEDFTNKNASGTLTGYYEPAIKAYHYPKKGAYPIYKHPNIYKSIA